MCGVFCLLTLRTQGRPATHTAIQAAGKITTRKGSATVCRTRRKFMCTFSIITNAMLLLFITIQHNQAWKAARRV